MPPTTPLAEKGHGDQRPPSARRPWAFFTALAVISFGLNWVWEMVQMPAYAEMAGRPWLAPVSLCPLATLGDVVFTFAAYGVGVLTARVGRGASAPRPRWPPGRLGRPSSGSRWQRAAGLTRRACRSCLFWEWDCGRYCN